MKAVICADRRTPFHLARKGQFFKVRPDTMTAGLAAALMHQLALDPMLLDDSGEAVLRLGVEFITVVPQGGFNFSPNPTLQQTFANTLERV